MRIAPAILLLTSLLLAGCVSEREELERERQELRQRREHLDTMLRNAPAGGRWNDHPDTHSLYRGMSDIDQRTREIDRRLGGHE